MIGGSLALVLMSGVGLSRLSFDADVLTCFHATASHSGISHLSARFGSLDHSFRLQRAGRPGHLGLFGGRGSLDCRAARRARDRVGDRDCRPGPELGLARRALSSCCCVTRARYALARLQPDDMSRALASTRDLLTMPSPAVAAMVRQDPLDLLGLLRHQLGGNARGSVCGSRKGDTSAPTAGAAS